MATITIDIPNAVAQRVVDAVLADNPPPPDVDVSTPALKVAYVKSVLVRYLQGIVQLHESRAAAQTAANKATAEVSIT